MNKITSVDQAKNLLNQQIKILFDKSSYTLGLSATELNKITKAICDAVLVFADVESRETLCKQAVLLAERSRISGATTSEVIALSDALTYTVYTLLQLT